MIFDKKIYTFLIIVVSAMMIFSCANRASGPTGGPKDTIPPVVLKSAPFNGALNFRKKIIEIHFDENVQIEKANDNVIISPPQIKSPEVKGNGKVVTVEIQEDLLDSTTYTINFGNAILDLNEKNPLRNYSFSFSTGDVIDTLKIAGKVINAEDLNPVKGVVVGIYQIDNDSMIFKKPFLRIAKTDENGDFVIENIRQGKYRVYALGDENHDFTYQQGENVAFIDSLFTPTVVVTQKADTVWKDSVTVDTVKHSFLADYFPKNVLFKLFKENFKRQYLVKSERKQAENFSLQFNAPQAYLPEIKPINFSWEGKYLLQKNATQDSLTYWLTDTELTQQDTLIMTARYQKSDSLNRLVYTTDTLNLIMRHQKLSPRPKNAVAQSEKVKAYIFSTNLASAFDHFSPAIFKFQSPLKTADLSHVFLYEKVDSTKKALKVNWQKEDSTGMAYKIVYKWEPEKSYELTVDSAAFTNIYNEVSNKYVSQFKIKSLDEYSGIKILLQPAVPNAIVQVLDTKDKLVASKPNIEKGTHIEFLKPGDYYLRLFIDANGNGKWDPGDVKKHIQPEAVYYYSKKLSLMANWEFEETWDINSLPLLQQKPKELFQKVEKTTNP